METEITLYTLDTCPMCKYIKVLLEQKEIQFNIVDDIEQMKNENICSVPQLKVGNVLLNLSEVQEWIKKR
jgi:glutaredoxin